MAVNKVEVNGETKLDLTQDTVTPENLLSGATAHNAAGEQISGAVAPVRYDVAQDLTSEQKAQARGNIDAAPGGFGLGTISQTVTDFDTVKLNGWYYGATGAAHAPDSEHDWSVCVTNLVHNIAVCIQDAYTITNTNAYLHRRRLVYIDTATQDNPWEWVNPPMVLGVEYRTTERHLGEPVYCKILEVSPITDGYRLTIGARKILRTSVYEVYNDSYIPVPHVPVFFKSSSLPDDSGMAYYTNVNEIVFAHGASNGSTKAVVTVYYTK